MSAARVAGVAASLLIPWAAAAQGLPEAGRCEQMDSVLGPLGVTTALEWTDAGAIAVIRGNRLPARVVGLRAHDDGFKLSALFDDPITGEAEMVIFSLPERDPVEYQLGVVRYETLGDGTRVVASMSGFSEADCTLGAARRAVRRGGSSVNR